MYEKFSLKKTIRYWWEIEEDTKAQEWIGDFFLFFKHKRIARTQNVNPQIGQLLLVSFSIFKYNVRHKIVSVWGWSKNEVNRMEKVQSVKASYIKM